MRFCIHRGSKQIGGSCVELESEGAHIVLDLGLPLDVEAPSGVFVPPIEGLRSPVPSLLGIVLSHGHRDHWGLLPEIPGNVPLFMGAATERIMRAAAPFVPNGFSPRSAAYLRDREAFHVGPFRITPYLVDHSGFDAYALLVETGGKRLFYSGDFRGHGRKAMLFERLLLHPPRDIDVLLMEGSSLGRLGEHDRFPFEFELESQLVEVLRKAPGMGLVACSAQNIDRVVTVYRAAKRTGRQLIVDAYTAEILKATNHPSVPKPTIDWPDVKVFIPRRQAIMLKRAGIAPIVDNFRGRRIWPEKLAEAASSSVLLVRRWMLPELERLEALRGAVFVWSQWHGYLAGGDGKSFRDDVDRLGLSFHQIHTSGHASPSDLQRFAVAVSPRRLVPIHTFRPEVFPQLFENVFLARDGEWQTV